MARDAIIRTLTPIPWVDEDLQIAFELGALSQTPAGKAMIRGTAGYAYRALAHTSLRVGGTLTAHSLVTQTRFGAQVIKPVFALAGGYLLGRYAGQKLARAAWGQSGYDRITAVYNNPVKLAEAIFSIPRNAQAVINHYS